MDWQPSLMVLYRADGGTPVLVSADERGGDADGALDLAVDLAPTAGGWVLEARARARRPLELLECAVSLVLPRRYARMFANGFQSWSASRDLGLDECLPLLDPGLAERWRVDRYGDYGFVTASGRPGHVHSHGFTWLTARGAPTAWIGSLDESDAWTVIHGDLHTMSIRVERDCAGARLDGETVLARLWLAEGELPELRAAYFAQLPRTRPPGPPLAGWTSWYLHYGAVSEAVVRANLAAIRGTGLPLDVVQVDDGWQAAVGDWLTAAPSFPRGMAALAADIRAAGFTPGLWLAPFVCAPGAALASGHPAWLLREADGSPVIAGKNPDWGGEYFVLDTEHPEVRAHVSAVLRTVVEDWGYGFLKLDFLYAPGLRPRPGRTRGAVLDSAMRLLDEATRGVPVLGCGVPILAAAGRMDYCRVGSDVGPFWEDATNAALGQRERISTLNSLRSTVGRWFLDGYAFGSDPDVFLLRDHDNGLTPAERETLFLCNRVLGRALFFSDDVSRYGPRELALLRSAFPWPAVEDLSVGCDADLVDARFRAGGRAYRLLANLGGTPRETVLDAPAWRSGGGPLTGRLDLAAHESALLLESWAGILPPPGGHLLPGYVPASASRDTERFSRLLAQKAREAAAGRVQSLFYCGPAPPAAALAATGARILRRDMRASWTDGPYYPFLACARERVREGMVLPEGLVYPVLADAFASFLATGTAVRREPVLYEQLDFERERCLESVARVFGAAVAGEPLVLVLGDLHEAAPSALEALVRLLGAPQAIPVVLVGCFERHPAFPNAERLLEWQSFLERLGELAPVLEFPGMAGEPGPSPPPAAAPAGGAYLHHALALLACADVAELARAAVEDASPPPDEAAQLQLVAARAEALFHLGRIDDALPFYARGLAAAERAGDARRAAWFHRRLAYAGIQGSDIDAGRVRRHALAALKRAAEGDDPDGYLQALLVHFLVADRFTEPIGRGLFDELLALLEAAGCAQALAYCRQNAYLYAETYDSIDEVAALVDASIAALEGLGSTALLSMAWHKRGIVETSRERYADALACYEKSAALRMALGWPRGIVRISNGIGYLHMLLEQYDRAWTDFRRAAEWLERIEDYNEAGVTYYNVARLYLHTGNYRPALALLDGVLGMMAVLGLAHIPYQPLRHLYVYKAFCHLRLGERGRALEYLDRQAGESPDLPGEPLLYLALTEGGLLSADGDRAGMAAAFARGPLAFDARQLPQRVLLATYHLEAGLIAAAAGFSAEAAAELSLAEAAARAAHCPGRAALCRELAAAPGGPGRDPGRRATTFLPEFPFRRERLLERARSALAVNKLHRRLGEIGFLNGFQSMLDEEQARNAVLRRGLALAYEHLDFDAAFIVFEHDGAWTTEGLLRRAAPTGGCRLDCARVARALVAEPRRVLHERADLEAVLGPACCGSCRLLVNVPLATAGRPGGMFVALVAGGENAPAAEDLAVLTTALRQMATKLESIEARGRLEVERNELAARNAVVEKDLDMARMIQHQLLPDKSPRPGLAFRYLTADKLGGDFLDILPFADGRVGVFLSDVSGHGVPAAFVTTQIKSALAQADPGGVSPAAVLEYLDGALFGRTAGNFVTAFYAVYDPATRSLRYASAGHPAPRVVCRDAVTSLDTEGLGPALAVVDRRGVDGPHTWFRDRETVLPPGARVLFYTDGLTEAIDERAWELGGTHEDFEAARLDAVLRGLAAEPAEAFLDGLLSALYEFHGGTALEDDACAVCLEVD